MWETLTVRKGKADLSDLERTLREVGEQDVGTEDL